MTQSSLHLLPVALSCASINQMSNEAIEAAKSLNMCVVERAKTARHFLKSIQHPLPLAQIEVCEIPITDTHIFFKDIISRILEGQSFGLLSEAGMPCIADPGHELVKMAHQKGIPVWPYAGPNSMLMALMASGFSGQNFQFHGYLPAKKEALREQVIKLVTILKKTGVAQIFMETPYRNKQVFEILLSHVPGDLELCVASQLGNPQQCIYTRPIRDWTEANSKLHYDLPSVFILGK
ncbi:MAG: SAM-dependent methyltransferase [Saprospiraceae bacterium]|nr:SAM-dependent methyltransferase [Saprospiraceae bacterium]